MVAVVTHQALTFNIMKLNFVNYHGLSRRLFLLLWVYVSTQITTSLTLNLLTTTIVAPPSNASKWQMGFNSAFKGLRKGDSHLKHNSLTSTIPYLTTTRALSPSHIRPWPPCGSFCTLTRPYPVTHLINGSGYFRAILFPYDIPTFHKPRSFYTHLPAYEDGTGCSETSAYKLQTPGNYPEESIQQNYPTLQCSVTDIKRVSLKS